MINSLKTLLAAGLIAVSAVAFTAPVDINQADTQTLAHNLNGIGLSKAEAIVAYREAHGPFRAAEDLIMVKGIGHGILDKNRDLIQVSGQ